VISHLSVSARQEIIIQPSGIERHDWYDLWRYRELFMLSELGGALSPLARIVVFTVIFGKIAKMECPYAHGICWNAVVDFFRRHKASNSLIGNANLVSKEYFPLTNIGGRRF